MSGESLMATKEKYELEFLLKTSPKILYNMISTPSGLAEWFADDVNIRGDVYTFIWDDSEETASLVSRKSFEFIKFKWTEQDEGTFFEFRIKIDQLTNEVALIVTDFADEDELDSARELWGSQVNELRQIIGG